MMNVLLLLYIMLSELVSFSLSMKTTISCPDTLCITINDNPCCGKNSGGPKKALDSLTIEAERVGHAQFGAGFPKDDYYHTLSTPTCYQIFVWPPDAVALRFTKELTLEYPPDSSGLYDRVIPQIFYLLDSNGNLVESPGNSCPNNVAKNAPHLNPYYDPERNYAPIGVKGLKVPFTDSFEQSNNLIDQHVNSVSPTEQAGTIIKEADSSVYAGKLDLSAFSNPGNPMESPFSPSVDVASTFNSNFNTNPVTAGLTGGADTRYDFDASSTMPQYFPRILKRGAPVEFRA